MTVWKRVIDRAIKKIKLGSMKKKFVKNPKWKKKPIRWTQWVDWTILAKTHSWPICEGCLGWDESFRRETYFCWKGNNHILTENHWNWALTKH